MNQDQKIENAIIKGYNFNLARSEHISSSDFERGFRAGAKWAFNDFYIFEVLPFIELVHKMLGFK